MWLPACKMLNITMRYKHDDMQLIYVGMRDKYMYVDMQLISVCWYARKIHVWWYATDLYQHAVMLTCEINMLKLFKI